MSRARAAVLKLKTALLLLKKPRGREGDRQVDGQKDRESGGTRAAPGGLARLTAARRSHTAASILAWGSA